MSIIKHVTLQKIVAHDFRYVPRTYNIALCTNTNVNTTCIHTRSRYTHCVHDLTMSLIASKRVSVVTDHYRNYYKLVMAKQTADIRSKLT